MQIPARLQLSSMILQLLIFSIVACTKNQDYVPEYSKYIEDTELMSNIAGKFAFESDAKKLNKVAVSTQQMRIISCADFNGECVNYGRFLSDAIEFSQDSIITKQERKKLELEYNQMIASIKEGRVKLKSLKK